MNTNKKSLALKASKDFIFSVLALVIYNGVLQLVVYPVINSRVGETAFGTVLFLISAVSIMGAAFGTSASYSRMVAKKTRTHTNGDYNIFLLVISGLSVVVTAVVLLIVKELTFALYIQVLALMIVTVFRYYSDVEYRMNIKFVNYFIFFTCVSLGYLIGLGALEIGHRASIVSDSLYTNWVLVIFLGELLGILFTAFFGTLFKRPFFTKSADFAVNFKSAWTISGSNIIPVVILHSDRILLRVFASAADVTVFYTASVIGKIVALLTTPLNGIIISYFTNYKIKMTKKLFTLISIGALILAVVGSAACSLVSYFYVKILYPNVLTEASRFFFIANFGQILYFVSGSLMVMLLSFTKEKAQLHISIIYGVLFVLIVVPCTIFFGISGYGIALAVVNLIRLIATTIYGVKKL